MTIAIDSNKVNYTGNGVTTIFPFTFRVDSVADLKVYLYDIGGNTYTLLTNAVDYTVSGVPGAGSVTYNPLGVPMPSTKKLYLLRTVPILQGLDINNQGGFFPDTLEAALDTIVMGMQQLEEGLARAVKSALGVVTEYALPVAVAGTVLGWNVTGTALENKTLLSLSVASVVDTTSLAPYSHVDVPTQYAVKTYVDTIAPVTFTLNQTLTGKFWTADAARIHRMTDRVLIDAAARDFNGEKTESASYVAAAGGSGYLDRATSFASYSSRGGVGGSFATRASDQYTTFPNQHAGPVPTPWLSGATGVLGQRTAYQGRVYDITVGGVFSASPPVHTAGAAANGAATLTFVDYTYMVPIGVSAFALQDSADTGTAVWAYYGETVTTAASPSFIAEWNAKNKTATNPINDPYNRFSLAMGLGLAGGGDPVAGAPTNPSSSAILIYKNGHTWNTGIVFDAIGITGTDGVTGFGTAIKLARGHVVEWQYAGGNIGFDFVSTVDQATDKQTLTVDLNGISFLNNSSLANFRIGKIAGTVTGNISATGSISAAPYLVSEGSATNVSFGFQTKGTGGYTFATNSAAPVTQFSIVHTASAVNYLSVTGSAAGNALTQTATGTDTDISVLYVAKGAGRHLFSANTVHQAALAGTVLHVEGKDATTAQLQIDGFAGAPTLYARRASGTSASPTAVASGNALLRISADGRYDASNYAGGSRAEVRLVTAEAWTASAQGANVELWVTPIGSTTQARLVTVTQFGLNIDVGKIFSVNNVQVVAGRDTGWTAMTGTPDKATAFATSTVTLAQLAGRVMSLQTALTTHGLIGA